eukprot:385593-Lingulodinium_polyedra.AAC.1
MPPRGSSAQRLGWAARNPNGAGYGSKSTNRRTGGPGVAEGEGTMACASADGLGLREDRGERERGGVA